MNKIKEILKKAVKSVIEFTKKLNRKAVIAGCAVLILGIAVLFNFLVMPNNRAVKSDTVKPKLDLTDVSGAISDKKKEEGSTKTEDAFAQMTLSRQQARDEAVEVLTDMAESSTAIDSVKTEAMTSLSQIAKDMESEANIESLVKAKGYEKCVAVVNGDSASIIVKSDGLLENEVAQISEIVWKEAGIHPDNLNIIESK